MPPRQPALPEGTDHIVAGASAEGGTGSGFVARPARRVAGTDRLVSQVRDQVTNLRGQAGERCAASPTTARARRPACSTMSAR